MFDLSEKSMTAGRRLPAAYYAKMAIFFLKPSDPRVKPAFQRFSDNVLAENGVTANDTHHIPYQDKQLTAYRFMPEKPRGSIVVFGGYDSYIIEWLPMALALRDAGMDTVIFDGPGQGTALDAGMPMTPGLAFARRRHPGPLRADRLHPDGLFPGRQPRHPRGRL